MVAGLGAGGRNVRKLGKQPPKHAGRGLQDRLSGPAPPPSPNLPPVSLPVPGAPRPA